MNDKYQIIRLLKKALKKNSNILIGKNNILDPSAILQTNFGGVIKIGANNEFLPGVILMTYGGKIQIGDYCSINPYTIIYGHGEGTTIGNNVLIAGHCMIIPANHIYSNKDLNINCQGISSKGIAIEDDVWIGGGCKILDGVRIGEGSIVAAGSIVTTSIPKYSVYAGVPAKFIKFRE